MINEEHHELRVRVSEPKGFYELDNAVVSFTFVHGIKYAHISP